MNKYGQYFIAVVIFLLSYQVNATLITLDNNNIRNTGIYFESNFKITAPVDLVNGKLDLKDSPHLSDIGFSGGYMETWNTEAVFNLETDSGNPFDLISLDIGSYHGAGGTHLGLAAWTLTGFNGRSEIFSLINPESFGRLILDWTNLTRVTMQSYRASAASSFDNIEAYELPPVVTPPTLLSAANFGPQARSLPPSVSVNAPNSTLLIAAGLFFLILRRSAKIFS